MISAFGEVPMLFGLKRNFMREAVTLVTCEHDFRIFDWDNPSQVE